MSKILLINETFFLLPNQSLSTEYKQLSCILNMKIWLIIHFIITRSIDAFFLSNIVLVYGIIMLFFFRYLRRLNNFVRVNWLDLYNLHSYSAVITVLKNEMKLIFIYVYVAFLYTRLQLVNSNYTVTYLNFLRWLIEAASLPQILIFTFREHFFGLMNFFEVYHLFYVPTIINKIPMFILIRYAENQPDCFLNWFQISLFDMICYWSPIKKYLLELY